MFILTIPGDITYVFAIRAVGTGGGSSPLSNIASVSMAAADDSPDNSSSDDDSLGLEIILPVVITGVMLVALLVIIVFVKMSKGARARQNRKTQSNEYLYDSKTSPYAPSSYPGQFQHRVPIPEPYWNGPRY